MAPFVFSARLGSALFRYRCERTKAEARIQRIKGTAQENTQPAQSAQPAQGDQEPVDQQTDSGVNVADFKKKAEEEKAAFKKCMEYAGLLPVYESAYAEGYRLWKSAGSSEDDARFYAGFCAIGFMIAREKEKTERNAMAWAKLYAFQRFGFYDHAPAIAYTNTYLRLKGTGIDDVLHAAAEEAARKAEQSQ